MVLRPLVSVVVLASLVLTGGCFRARPTVELVSVAADGVTDQGRRVLLTLEAANANDEQLPLSEVRYRVEDRADGSILFEGVRLAEATLPPRGSQRFVVPAALPAAEGASAGQQARVVGTVTYELPGTIAELLFDTRVRRPKARFDEVIDLP